MRRTGAFPCFRKAQTGGEAEDAERARERESNLKKNEMKSLFKEAARTVAEHITEGNKLNTAPERSSQASVGMLIRTKDPFPQAMDYQRTTMAYPATVAGENIADYLRKLRQNGRAIRRASASCSRGVKESALSASTFSLAKLRKGS